MRNKVIVTEEVQGDHVIVHKLEPGDKLAELVSQYRSNILVKAVVVVNTGDSYILKPGYLKGIEKSNFPLIVVTANDGQQLLEILDQSDDVLCDIDVESTVDVLVSTSQPQSESQRTKKNSTGGQDKGKQLVATMPRCTCQVVVIWREVHALPTFLIHLHGSASSCATLM